jgi:hypothetical protein
MKCVVRLFEWIFMMPDRRRVRWAMEDHFDREVRKLKERGL